MKRKQYRAPRPDNEPRYYVDCEPSESGRGFVGLYGIPGKDQQLVTTEDGKIEFFDSEDEAIAAAGEDLCEALNKRTKGYMHKLGYRVIGGAELAVSLKQLGISANELALIYGTTLQRVLDWIDGVLPIPRPMDALLHLLKMHGAKEAAMSNVKEITYSKESPPSGKSEEPFASSPQAPSPVR